MASQAEVAAHLLLSDRRLRDLAKLREHQSHKDVVIGS